MLLKSFLEILQGTLKAKNTDKSNEYKNCSKVVNYFCNVLLASYSEKRGGNNLSVTQKIKSTY